MWQCSEAAREVPAQLLSWPVRQPCHKPGPSSPRLMELTGSADMLRRLAHCLVRQAIGSTCPERLLAALSLPTMCVVAPPRSLLQMRSSTACTSVGDGRETNGSAKLLVLACDCATSSVKPSSQARRDHMPGPADALRLTVGAPRLSDVWLGAPQRLDDVCERPDSTSSPSWTLCASNITLERESRVSRGVPFLKQPLALFATESLWTSADALGDVLRQRICPWGPLRCGSHRMLSTDSPLSGSCGVWTARAEVATTATGGAKPRDVATLSRELQLRDEIHCR